uniref:Uncharacterized protein n=1 Tax=Brassica campestris TaxID=3711 RepID=M4DX70_BRACM
MEPSRSRAHNQSRESEGHHGEVKRKRAVEKEGVASRCRHSLKNFFATKPKEIYRIADLRVTICFSKVLKPTMDIGETSMVSSETIFSLSALYLMQIIELLF